MLVSHTMIFVDNGMQHETLNMNALTLELKIIDGMSSRLSHYSVYKENILPSH